MLGSASLSLHANILSKSPVSTIKFTRHNHIRPLQSSCLTRQFHQSSSRLRFSGHLLHQGTLTSISCCIRSHISTSWTQQIRTLLIALARAMSVSLPEIWQGEVMVSCSACGNVFSSGKRDRLLHPRCGQGPIIQKQHFMVRLMPSVMVRIRHIHGVRIYVSCTHLFPGSHVNWLRGQTIKQGLK